MTPHTIPVYRVRGSHREIGQQIGDLGADKILDGLDKAFGSLPAGRSRDDQLALAAEYRAFTEPRMPWLIEELDGCAEAAGVDPLSFFASSIEELWYEPLHDRTQGRCSDMVAGPAATAKGHVLVGHNNDLHPESEDEIVALVKIVPNEPVIFQLGGAPWLSVGFNSAGLSLTGNELSPNDERVGISRSHQVMQMMRSGSLHEMIAEAIRPDRASSYNNVLVDNWGDVANVEGSATDVEITSLDDQDHLAHTNHYVCDRMLAYEGDAAYASHSAVRYARAQELLSGEPPGSITPARLRELLSDHETKPDSLCKHTEWTEHSKTVFWCVADVTEGRVEFGHGNPCDSVAQEYVFETYPDRDLN